MAAEIKIKRSSVSGNIPTNAQVGTGELALNMADRDLYYSDGSNINKIKGHFTGSSAPTSPTPVEGDLWYDTTANTLKTYDGTSWNSTTSSGGLSEEEVSNVITTDVTKSFIDALGVDANDADTLDGQQGSYYTSYTDTAISNLLDSAPTALDTLNELAAALGDDANFSTTITNSIGTKWTQDNTKISNWDTAYSWGDHSLAGYLTSETYSTPAELLTAVKTVDGSGSGLDADTLDGIHASSFVQTNSSPTFSTVNATTIDFGDWTITESNGSLYFATGGTNKMKLDANGNLDVVGNVNSSATIT